ncbi:MAG TPA: PilZ domain-containing protein [Terriglobales bacterium]|jgi:hypothetical protein|nr:PilZ domain-containing protein [Terriglobales bacterium]
MLEAMTSSASHGVNPAERRRWQRLPIAVPVFIRGVDINGKDFIEFVSALNISAGGMLIVARRYLPSLTGLSLEIPTAPLPTSNLLSQSVRSFKVKVMRHVVADNCHYVAFKFNRSLATAER